jgi:hypothetical protein
MPASSYFLRSYEHEETARFSVAPKTSPQFFSAPAPPPKAAEPVVERPPQPAEKAPAAHFEKPGASHIERAPASHTEKAPAARPRFSHQPTRARDRKPVQKSASGRVARRPIRDARSSAPRSAGSSRHAQGSRWAKTVSTASKNGNGNGNGHSKRLAPRAGKSSSNGARFSSNGHSAGNGRSANGKAAAKPAARRADASRKSARPVSRAGSRAGARPDARSGRKPALTASAKAGNRSRYGFTASSNRRSKKSR